MTRIDVPPDRPGCPSRGELIAFCTGGLPAETLAAIGTHLSACPACEAALSELEDPGGRVGSALRVAGPAAEADTLSADPEYRRLEAWALAVSADPPPQLPAALGVYDLGGRIGGGGMGTVYRAFHTRLKKWVALKVVRADQLANPKAVARFQREMEAVGRLDHPNIIRATDAGEADGVHYLVMDLIDGVDLGRVARCRGPVPVADACELARQAAEALQAAHAAGLVHRDVKPSNLLLSAAGQVKLLDLGLARLGGTRDELTARGQIMGTTDYMAPEQWEAGHAVDVRADLYSLGCTLFTLLTGHPPFAGPAYDTLPRKMAAHLNHPPPPVRDLRPDVPAGVAAVVARLLAKDPAARYPAPAAVARALAPFTAGADLPALARGAAAAPDAAASTVSAPPQAATVSYRPAARRARWPWLAGGAAVLAAVVGFAALYPRDPGRTEDGPPVAPEPVPGEWFDLLRQQPTDLVWPAAAPDDRWTYDEGRKDVWVNSRDQSVFRLGAAPDAPFDLEVVFAQNPWVGGAGVFVRGRAVGEGADTYLVADAFFPHRSQPREGEAAPLSRNLLRYHPGQNLSNFGFINAAPVRVPTAADHTLRVTVGWARVTGLDWDGRPAAGLLTPAADARHPGPPGGDVGVVVEGSSVIVRSARLRVHPLTGEQP